jgi:DNA-binding CsgD family transcriptional regulator
MDNFSPASIILLWKQEYSSYLTKQTKHEATQQFHHIAGMCAPGLSYYYILNYFDLSLEYIHPNVEYVIGIRPSEITIEKLLKIALPEELQLIEKKEKITSDFFYNHIRNDDLVSYKTIYTYKFRGQDGRNRTMLIQSTPLSLNDSGKIEHLFSIHTDITHLGNFTTDWISFISLNGKKSYMNIKTAHDHFDPKLPYEKTNSSLTDLTKREKEIIKLMSLGLSAKAISEKLFISFNTTRTHRKNILCKTKCVNTAELVAKCLGGGVI